MTCLATKVEVCPAEHLLSGVGAQLGQARRVHATASWRMSVA
jgi:hypothetical protein